VIFDKNGLDYLEPYLSDINFFILPTRGESINLYILLKSFAKLNFWRTNSFDQYVAVYIEFIAPKAVITFTDNDQRFYNISRNCPGVKTIMIQNGVRSISGDVFDSLKYSENFRVDYILSMNSAFGEKYLEYMEGEVIPIGSFKNNLYKKSSQIKCGQVLFISQWHPEPLDGTPIYTENDGTRIMYEEFFKVDTAVLELLSKWCSLNSKQLTILGRSLESQECEGLYFSKLLPVGTFQYLPKNSHLSNYDLLDQSEIVVFIDSTLGYESIARGNRTAGFAWRADSYGRQLVRFGWPLELESEGQFWSNKLNETRFQNIMDYLNGISDTEWNDSLKKHQKKLMEYDPDNSIFKNLLKDIF
jgi:surface carbohydrate biosynthesis protein